MGHILTIIKVLHVVIQKGIDLHKSGVAESVLEHIKHLTHSLHDTVHGHHAEHCPDENARLDHPDAMRQENTE